MALPGVKTTILDRFVCDFSGNSAVFIQKKAKQKLMRILAMADGEEQQKEIQELREFMAFTHDRPMIYPDPEIYPEMIEGMPTSIYKSEFTEWETYL